jgi:hypothetical protein
MLPPNSVPEMSGTVGSRPANEDPASWPEQSVTAEVLDDACKIHNNFPPETSLPIDEEEHLAHLRKILWDCKAWNKVGIIALHQHETLLPNHSFVGDIRQLDDERYACYIQKFANEEINIDKVCGYMFAYVEGKGLRPFLFRQGQMLDLSGVDKTLVPRIIQYLVQNRLTSRLGLGLLIPELSKNKVTEFPMGSGMALVPTELLLLRKLTTVATEWHWDPRTGVFGVGTGCVILKSGKHVKPKTDDKELTLEVDFAGVLRRVNILQS